VPIADFIHLKVRSAYSLTEGAIKLDKVVALAKAESMPAVAVTDRNNLFGALEFAQYAANGGIQPIIGCDLAIGRFAMVGMGSVVTKSIPDFTLVIGAPARPVGYVCRCGAPLRHADGGTPTSDGKFQCSDCTRSYVVKCGLVSEN